MASVYVWFLAMAARGLYLWQIRHAPIFTLLLGDGPSYDAWAQRIAAGDWVGKGVFYQAPLYPYFLGLLYTVVGRNLLVVRLIQIVIGAGSCVLLVQAGQRFFSRTVGVIAGAILALYPTAIYFDCSIQKSVLDLFLLCALLATLGGLLEGRKPRGWFAAGILLGLLGLTRENAMIFFPVLLVWLFVHWRREPWRIRRRWAALLVIGIAMALLPVACRNRLVGGEFHLTTAQFGPNFYMGNGSDATGLYMPLRWGRGDAEFERTDATILAEQAEGRSLSPSGVSNYWTRKTLDEIRADFGRWLLLLGHKWTLTWNVSEVGDGDDQYTCGDWSPLLRALNPVVHFGTLCPLAALGICLTWSRRERLWLLYLMILGYAASVTMFYVFSRYRFPLVPMLVLFAAAGLVLWREAIRNKRWHTLGTGLAAAILAAVFCNVPMVSEAYSRSATHYNLAISLVELDPNSDEALAECAEAVRLQPDFEQAHVELGVLLARRDRTAEAIDQYRQALQLRPDYPEAHNNLGVALVTEGKTDEAAFHFREAVRLNPEYIEARRNLALLLSQQGRTDEAIAQVESLLKLEPNSAEDQRALAVLLQSKGKPKSD